jgi:hypothetical protein
LWALRSTEGSNPSPSVNKGERWRFIKGILIKAAEEGYITQLACKMPECFYPEELGGAGYFVSLKEYSDWNPTHEHFPISKKDGGHRKWTTRSSRTGCVIASTTPSALAVGTRAILRGSG